MAGKWNVIIPTATTNYIKNPSFENNVTDGWTVNSAVTNLLTSDEQKFGKKSWQLSCASSTDVEVSADSVTVANGETVHASAWVYIASGGANITNTDIVITTGGVFGVGTTQATGSADLTLTDTWQRVTVSWTNSAGSLATTLNIVMIADVGVMYLDAVQLEIGQYTTYIDGSLDGGKWTGADHNSTTTRAVTYAYGGKVANFDDDLSYPIERHDGAGMPQIILNTQSYANVDGSKFQSMKYGERVFRLFGTSNDSVTNLTTLHSKRQALIKALMSVVQLGEEPPYKILRYTGATVTKECHVRLDSGLGLNMGSGFHENNLPIQFIGTDLNFYEVGNTAATLDVNDATTLRSLAVRTNNDWTSGGITTIGGNTQIWSLVEGAGDGKIYIGGDYTGLNSGGNNYFMVYDKVAGTYSQLGSVVPNAKVWKVAINSRGHVYISGDFTVVGVAPNTDSIAAWNGAAWVSITGQQTTVGGAQAFIYDMLFKENGNLVAVGTFDTIGGTAANQIAEYDGTSWSAISGGITDGDVFGVAQAPNGDLYFCGNFRTVNGDSSFRGIAKWDGTTWDNMNGGFGQITAGGATLARDVQVTKDGTVYCGGDFTQANGTSTTVGYIARWNGSIWDDMNGGVNNVVRRMLPLESGELLVAGDFTAKAAGTQHNLSGLATYNDTDFLSLDTDALTNPRGLAEIDGDLWIGHGGTASTQHAATTTIGYAGTSIAYPIISISRSGGTLAELRSIINETTNAVLYFNSYQLLDGETLTLNMEPENSSISSSLFGEIPEALLAVSDTSHFYLTNGNASGNYNNVLMAFAKLAGSPTITAFVEWRTAYISVD